jgi:hypothetical protein
VAISYSPYIRPSAAPLSIDLCRTRSGEAASDLFGLFPNDLRARAAKHTTENSTRYLLKIKFL